MRSRRAGDARREDVTVAPRAAQNGDDQLVQLAERGLPVDCDLAPDGGIMVAECESKVDDVSQRR
ncbi:hypothetical protein GCM10025773_25140 [Microbacterium jejuense]